MADKDQINQKIQSVGEDSSRRFGGNKELSRSIQEEAEKIIRNNDIKSEPDSIKDIEDRISRSLGIGVNDEIRLEAKRIRKEIEKWSLKNIEAVREYRRESVKKEIIDGYKKANPDISTEQLKLAEDQANLIADTYHGGPGIENSQSEILAGTIGDNVDLKGAYSHIEGTIKLLKNTPGQLKDIQSNYEKIKDGLSGLKQPTGIREFSSFDNIMGVLRNGNAMERFTGLGQSRVLGWADRINSWTGGAIGRTVVDFGGRFISRIGSESVRTFAENGLKLLAEKGFQGGFNAILSGGASAAVSTAAAGGTAAAIGTTAVTVGATAATGGIAALVMAGLAVLKGIKNFGKKIMDGINNLVANGKGEDEDINKLTKKKWFIPVLIIVILLTGCTLQNNQISTMVSPVKKKINNGINSSGSFDIPVCVPNKKDPNGNDRTILREIALSIVGKVKYDNDAVWNCIGACPTWGTTDKDRGVDCAKLASWVWLQCTGKSRAKEFGTTNHLKDNITYKTPGWQRVYPISLDDLKIGDIFVRFDTCNGKRCNHAGMYIGKNESGDGEVLETVGNGGDPIVTKIYSVKFGVVKFLRDYKSYDYEYTIRITDVFND